MKRAGIIFTLCGISATAGSNFQAPLVGVARDSQGQLRVVCGMRGNFILKDTVAPAAVNWAFTGEGGLVETNKDLLYLDSNGAIVRTSSAPHDDMIFAPATAHSGALYFIPDTSGLWQAGAGQDRMVPLDPDAIGGDVVALDSVNRKQAELAVCRGQDLWLLAVDLRTGNLVHQSIAGVIGGMACKPPQAGSLLLLDGELVLATANELIVQSATGSELRLTLAGTGGGKPEIRRAGEAWVEVEIPGQAPVMVRLTGGVAKVYRLPAAEGRP